MKWDAHANDAMPYAQNTIRILRRRGMNSHRVPTLMSLYILQLTCLYENYCMTHCAAGP